ncbi:MAG: GTPase ObgE [Treponema sp.]|nr:GTPase ObgE [Treponema sp.]
MLQFADEAVIEVRSGKGGNGCIAFRREKYIPRGGPNGGDGGKGGDVVFCVKQNMRTLSKLRNQVVFKAKSGGDGQGWNKHGKNGEDVVIPLPPGTTIWDAETDELVYDFTAKDANTEFVYLKGGSGGWGNTHFKSATNQAPRRANPGEPSVIKKLRLELSIMADIGLVGFPNAGKSSLLNAFTNARPKIAPYPFTTKIPHLGVLRVSDERDIIIADIPGIIEGASSGAGLGFQFLKHISRTLCLIYMIDCSDPNCFTAYQTLKNELSTFSKELSLKKSIVLCNKIDLDEAMVNAQTVSENILKYEKDAIIIPVSVLENTNMGKVRNCIINLVDSLEEKSNDAQSSAKSSFLESRSVDESMEVQYPGAQ